MTEQQLTAFLCEYLAEQLKAPASSIDIHKPLDTFGIDSIEILTLTCELEDLIGKRIEPTVIWDFRSIAKLSAHLADNAAAPLSDTEVSRQLAKLKRAGR